MICSTIQSIDKALVARRFAHARNTYGREALVQQQVAEKMLRLLTKHACRLLRHTTARVIREVCQATPPPSAIS